jgi:hypothetical protein
MSLYDTAGCGPFGVSRDLCELEFVKRPRPMLASLFPDLSAHKASKLKGKEIYETYRFYAYGNSEDTERFCNRVLQNKEKYDYDLVFCGMCGCTDKKVLQKHLCFPNLVTFFCKDQDCFDKYKYCAVNYYDLTYGIPYLWKMYAKKNQRLYRSVPDDESAKPKCAYCNESNENVVYHPLILSWFQHNSFCKNSTCCKRYIYFVENVPRIPFVFDNKK